MAGDFDPRCETCAFAKLRRGTALAECRRQPPQVGPAGLALWPKVRKDDSCGDYTEAAE